MHGLKFYITPEYILNQLSEEDKNRFNKCAFTDVVKDTHNGIEISCLLFNEKEQDEGEDEQCRAILI